MLRCPMGFRLRQTPHAFSHFTLEHSGGRQVVVDIQGVGSMLTDPQIHSVESSHNGPGNRDDFVLTHECNAVCRWLDLDASFGGHRWAVGQVERVLERAKRARKARELKREPLT